MTERVRFTFEAKSYPDGSPYIMLKRNNENLDVLEHGFLGFDLQEGISAEEVDKLLDELNEKVAAVTFHQYAMPNLAKQRAPNNEIEGNAKIEDEQFDVEAALAELDAIATDVGTAWQGDTSAVAAVREQRREL